MNQHPWGVRWLVIAAISVRLAAAGALALGPWTNSPAELAGWDVERFQEIADTDGRAWVDHEVEYPPGSVVAIEAIARPTVVGTHRTLVVTSLLIDGAIALLVALIGGRRAGAWYLLLGLPLVPMGLLRLDLWSAALAVLAVVALGQRRPKTFAVLTTLAALVKVWPALLVAPAAALGRWRAVGWTAALMTLGGLAWIGWAGWSLDPVSQVISLRGATGWHIESVPGSMVALFGDAEPELQFNAYRIGSLSPLLVRFGQALAIATTIGLAVGGYRAVARRRTDQPGSDRDDLRITAVVMVGAVSALIVTAPLLSPQFLLWLTPWAALAMAGSDGNPGPGRKARHLVWSVGAATLTTGATLTIFGPPDLDVPAAAVLLLIRDGFLVLTVAIALQTLYRLEPLAPENRAADHAASQPPDTLPPGTG